LEQVAFDDGMQACIACHTPVRERDWVFTDPAVMPDQ
jgi:adenosyl cobinamide kinase/adenosyl cobinamide phosphate guanylyltransferase